MPTSLGGERGVDVMVYCHVLFSYWMIIRSYLMINPNILEQGLTLFSGDNMSITRRVKSRN